MFVALFKTDATGEIFDIEAVHDNNGHTQLDIYEEELEEDLGDTQMPAESVVTTEQAQAAVDVFHDLRERRGLTEEEKDLIWNAMVGVCYEHVRQRQGAFEAIKPLLADGEFWGSKGAGGNPLLPRHKAVGLTNERALPIPFHPNEFGAAYCP